MQGLLLLEPASHFPIAILFCSLTFWVILVTLVGRGLLLPAVIGWLGLPKIAETEQIEERKAQLAARHDCCHCGKPLTRNGADRNARRGFPTGSGRV